MTIINMTGGGASQETKSAQFDGYLELNRVSYITRTTNPVVKLINDAGTYFDSKCTIKYSDGMLVITQQKPINLIQVMPNRDSSRCHVARATETSSITNDHNLSTYLKAACPVGKRFTALIEGYLGIKRDSAPRNTVAIYETDDPTYDTLNGIVSGYKSVYSFTATGDNTTCTYPTEIPASVCSAVEYYQTNPSVLYPIFVVTRITYTTE